ncbi:hypothetical protein [uncultured Stenotrophomonas sp.]|uniref:hypothetical protein n=1 Tax=uncultured Stenotrophomonas sp. TaxID=165438 RepID=UPI0028E3CB66|nr:hypothetical protein [uncultured Stenotrophomonas sp.]
MFSVKASRVCLPIAPGQNVAQAGNTLRNIAQRVNGTDQHWQMLADANGFGDADAQSGS